VVEEKTGIGEEEKEEESKRLWSSCSTYVVSEVVSGLMLQYLHEEGRGLAVTDGAAVLLFPNCVDVHDGAPC
jgi:hypothetical protein